MCSSPHLGGFVVVALCVQVEVEIQRYAVLALANLGTTVANHHAMMEEGTLPLLISMANNDDEEIRQCVFQGVVHSNHCVWPTVYLHLCCVWCHLV